MDIPADQPTDDSLGGDSEQPEQQQSSVVLRQPAQDSAAEVDAAPAAAPAPPPQPYEIQIPPSQNLQAVFYDPASLTLRIIFHGRGKLKGATYAYKQVSSNVAEGFSASGLNADAYFRANILKQYETVRPQDQF